MWLNVSKGTSCRKTWFWATQVQSQNISKYGPITRSNLRFHIFWSLQYLLSKLLEGFYVKMVLSYKIGLLNCYCMPILCPDFQTSTASSSKSTVHLSVMMSSITLSYVRMQCRISKKFCTKIEHKEQPCRK